MAGPEYRYQYVSAVVSMGPIVSGTARSLDIWMANNGSTAEHFRVQFLKVGDPLDVIEADHTVEPHRVVSHGLAQAGSLWWVRIYVTSRNLVPTLRFHVDPPIPQAPEVYFGPGDFATFTLQVRVEPEPPIPGGPIET